ncbi:MAG: proline--tRNA ligase [Anaerolineae bacterium]|nr:proline--tRNA ligase [Anaerolineae bacterium]
MRLSQHFGRTLRDAPSDAQMTSHKLIVRAGLARPLAAGIWSLLPLGWRVFRKLEAIIREEMDAIGVEEMLMPVLHPAELWQTSGRWESVDVLMKLQNREGRPFVLAPTCEEVVTDLCRQEVESYKDLPRYVYHIQTKERDELRARGGMIRLREFTMKDAYSMNANTAGLDVFYEAIYQAYLNIFERCGIDIIPVEADTGTMGGSASHEFVMAHDEGEDRFVRCADCGYAANVEAAAFIRRDARNGDPAPLEKVATPDCKTIAELCNFLSIPPEQTLKAVFYTTNDGDLVLAMLRGDLDVNEVKLMSKLGASTLEPATEEQIAAVGAAAGYASPIGIDVRKEGGADGLLVIVDPSLESMSNFVTGANEAGYHVVNANYPRDFEVTRIADIAEPYDGATCEACGGTLHIESATELGHCFKLGTRYSKPFGATYVDENGQEQYVIMGSYGIGLDRLMAAVIEAHHDDYGILWPREVAPYDIHIVAITKDDTLYEVADQLYADLRAAGFDVVYDDRGLSPGVMFNDADLIGVPLRVTVSTRSLEQGGIEIKWRHEKERQILPLEGAVEQIASLLETGQAG